MSKILFWPFTLIFFSLVAGILAWGNFGGALRPIFLFVFLLVGPGLSFTRLLQLDEFLVELVLAIAISLVISTLLAEIMVFSHIWSPLVGILILISVSLVGDSLQIQKLLRSLPQMDE